MWVTTGMSSSWIFTALHMWVAFLVGGALIVTIFGHIKLSILVLRIPAGSDSYRVIQQTHLPISSGEVNQKSMVVFTGAHVRPCPTPAGRLWGCPIDIENGPTPFCCLAPSNTQLPTSVHQLTHHLPITATAASSKPRLPRAPSTLSIPLARSVPQSSPSRRR